MIGKRTGRDLEGSDLGLMHFPQELENTAKILITATPSLSLPVRKGDTAGLPVLLYENNTANLS